ncbi:flagellar basal body P-ring formation chaperone FlgA [Methylomarinum sp. Ch1-1]|uniref:Flagella basal body P-ring formation protein FlgA n=1 Tax=Methylomarinum roseum TaxID=3067653 RepID=A0AAU7NUI3_9GAMM|nr:flagellar basal body P-ring formation chaperone FlgA [Methylomarinum sp. Ch1-1]MDP4519268.1 flagellar basal body P-ring formation chaperone FlgA [Methylomarinum sp. Ch1-1]
MNAFRYHILAILLFAYTQSAVAATRALQPISSIKTAIANFVNNNFEAVENFEYSLMQLDPRLRLSLCDEPLQVFSQSGALEAGRNTIGIHCPTGQKWTIYTVAQIKAFRKVLVLSQPLRRGDIISERHLSYKTEDLSDLRRGYLLNPKRVINQQATRNLAAGTVINRSHFSKPTLINRGERVNIQASSPYFTISMAGIALMDGHKGQNIRVKNINSKRIVQATVVEPGLVSVY